MDLLDEKDLLKKADAAELKAGRTDDRNRRADLLQIAICLRWLAARDCVDPNLMKRLDLDLDARA